MFIGIGEDLLKVLLRKGFPPHEDFVGASQGFFDFEIISAQDTGFEAMLLLVGFVIALEVAFGDYRVEAFLKGLLLEKMSEQGLPVVFQQFVHIDFFGKILFSFDKEETVSYPMFGKVADLLDTVISSSIALDQVLDIIEIQFVIKDLGQEDGFIFLFAEQLSFLARG